MVKKIAALAGAGAILLAASGPAFGRGWWWMGGSRDTAVVNNGAVAAANTGGNTQDNYAYSNGGEAEVKDNDGNRYMSTGVADADAKAVVAANTHVGCGRCAGGGRHHKDLAVVNNGAVAGANTGDNYQDNWVETGDGDGGEDEAEIEGNGGDQTMYTGPANSKARAWTVVNTHWGGMVF